MPLGRLAEDGPIPVDAYPELQETSTADPEERTRANVRESDATLVILPDIGCRESPGTNLTIETAKKLKKPLLILPRSLKGPEDLLEDLRKWLGKHRPATLNIAGPRQSENKDLGNLTRYLLLRLFGRIPEPREDRLLKITSWSALFVFLATSIFFAISDYKVSGTGDIFLLIAGVQLFRSSHTALRYITFSTGFLLASLIALILYHLCLWRPIEFEDGSWLPLFSLEFFKLAIMPGMLVAGLFSLALLVHRSRQIKFATKAVKAWAVVFALFFLVDGILEVRDHDRKEHSLTKEQLAAFEEIKAFYQTHGDSPSPMERDAFRKELRESGHAMDIFLTDHHAPSSRTFSSRELEYFGKRATSIEWDEKTTIKFKDGTVWQGRSHEDFIQGPNGKWYKLEATLGNYVDPASVIDEDPDPFQSS